MFLFSLSNLVQHLWELERHSHPQGFVLVGDSLGKWHADILCKDIRGIIEDRGYLERLNPTKVQFCCFQLHGKGQISTSSFIFTSLTFTGGFTQNSSSIQKDPMRTSTTLLKYASKLQMGFNYMVLCLK